MTWLAYIDPRMEAKPSDFLKRPFRSYPYDYQMGMYVSNKNHIVLMNNQIENDACVEFAAAGRENSRGLSADQERDSEGLRGNENGSVLTCLFANGHPLL